MLKSGGSTVRHQLERLSALKGWGTNSPLGTNVGSGEVRQILLHRPANGHAVPAQRVVYGALSMGLCELWPRSPCVYFTLLREPVSRLFSEWAYFCVHGAEGRKRWLPAWKRGGECPLSAIEWLEEHTNPNLLTTLLARGDWAECGDRCGVRQAKATLTHPCLRYLLLDRIQDGFNRIAQASGGQIKLVEEGNSIPVKNHPKGVSHREERIARAQENASLRRQVNQVIERAGDAELYRFALEQYQQQWDRPLLSCNAWRV